MSKITCKRCKKKFNSYQHLTKNYGLANGMRFMMMCKGGQVSNRPIKLCKECMSELEKWFESEEVRNDN